MAIVSGSGASTTSITVTISNLTYMCKQYGGFKCSVNGVEYIWGDSSSAYSTSGLVTGLNPGTSYSVEGFAHYSGTWWPCTNKITVSTQTPPKLSTPSFSSATTSTTSITINYNYISGAERYDIQCSNGVTASPINPSYQFTGLSPNTQYSFRCMCRNIHGEYSDSNWSSYTYITTNALPQLSTPTYNSSSKTATTITITFNTVSGADRYDIYCTSGYTAPNLTSPTATFSGCTPNTQYGFRCQARDIDGQYATSNWSGYTYITTNALPQLSTPTYNSSSKTATTITITFNTVSGANRYDIYCTSGYTAPNLTSPTETFSGCTPNTQYGFRCMARDTTGNHLDSAWSGYTYITTSNPRPAAFSWDTAKNSGSQFNLTAVEWNRLIQNVKDVHTYKLGSYNASQYPMNNVGRGGVFYADRFNEVRLAIGSLNPTGIGDKSRGNIIYASDLNTLVSKLNSITL